MPEIHIWSDHGTPEKPHNRSPKQQKMFFQPVGSICAEVCITVNYMVARELMRLLI